MHEVRLRAAELPNVCMSCRCCSLCGDPLGSSPILSYIYLLTHVPGFLVNSTPVNGAPLFMNLCLLSLLFLSHTLILVLLALLAQVPMQWLPVLLHISCSRTYQ